MQSGSCLFNLRDGYKYALLMCAQVRAAVVEMLDAWASVAPIDSLISELMAMLLSAKCTADGKADGIQWLATQVRCYHVSTTHKRRSSC